MPSKRTRVKRTPPPEFSEELIRWIQGKGEMPVEGYFLMPDQMQRLETYRQPKRSKP